MNYHQLTMADHIVVGVDGSAAGERVLEHAAARAARIGVALEIVHVTELPSVLEPTGLTMAAPDIDQLQAISEELLADARARVTEQQPGVDVATRNEVGNPAQLLAELSEGADCLFVGRRGVGAVESALLGSVSASLASTARCPLIVIGDRAPIPTDGPLLVGLDDSEFSVAAARFALAEAAGRGTTVRAVNGYRTAPLAVPTEPELIEALKEGEKAEAERALESALTAAGADRAGVEVQRIVVEAAPAEAVLSQAKDAQLIVVGSQGKGFVRRLVLGSVSRQILQEAELPVVVINVPKE